MFSPPLLGLPKKEAWCASLDKSQNLSRPKSRYSRTLLQNTNISIAKRNTINLNLLSSTTKARIFLTLTHMNIRLIIRRI